MKSLKQTNERQKQVMEIFFDEISNSLLIRGYTTRLFIRSYLAEDFEKCSALYGDKELTKFFDNGKPRTEKQIIDYIEERGCRYFKRGQPFGLFSVFLKDDNSFVGQVDLVPTDNSGEVEIGWIFHKNFHNKGFCSEAVLNFLMPLINKIHQMNFNAGLQRVNRIIATAHPENIASNKVIEKAGLTLYQQKLRYEGNPRNWYSLTLNQGG